MDNDFKPSSESGNCKKNDKMAIAKCKYLGKALKLLYIIKVLFVYLQLRIGLLEAFQVF